VSIYNNFKSKQNMFDEAPKQSINKGDNAPDLTKVNNTPPPTEGVLPKPKQALPKPPTDLSAFPPKKIGDVEDIFADVDKDKPQASSVKGAGSIKKSKALVGEKPPMSVYIGFAVLALVIFVGGSWLVVKTLTPSRQIPPKGVVIEEREQEQQAEIATDTDEQLKELQEKLMKDEEEIGGVQAHLESATGSAMEATTSDSIKEKEEEKEMAIIKDTDNDGLTDAEEAELGTNPVLVDTDKDQLTDYEELYVYFTNAMAMDSDEDGLDDYEEVTIYFSDPSNIDSDGDGYNDGIEVENGYNPIGPGKIEVTN